MFPETVLSVFGLCKDPLNRLVKLYQTDIFISVTHILSFIKKNSQTYVCLYKYTQIIIFHHEKFPSISCFSIFHTFCSSLKYSLKENTERFFFFVKGKLLSISVLIGCQWLSATSIKMDYHYLCISLFHTGQLLLSDLFSFNCTNCGDIIFST